MDFQHEVIICIVNEGFSETAMDAARPAGATGGTVMRAHGTASPDAEKYYGITVTPHKEIVMILTDKEHRNGILKALYAACGPTLPAQGIAFALPVDGVAGLGENSAAKQRELNGAGAE